MNGIGIYIDSNIISIFGNEKEIREMTLEVHFETNNHVKHIALDDALDFNKLLEKICQDKTDYIKKLESELDELWKFETKYDKRCQTEKEVEEKS